MDKVRRVFLVILDSAGCGALPDADDYGDTGSNTLRHVLTQCPRELTNLQILGLANIISLPLEPEEDPKALYGKMMEKSAGKDTTTGHWELMGLVLDKPFPTYPEGFPQDVVEKFESAVGRRILGNKPASGTVIIEELGQEHMETGCPIVYTSADSVFQIAAHEEVVKIDKLYEWCEQAREMLTGKHSVCRVIARPFEGKPGSFKRTPRRHDYALPPGGETVLDRLVAAGVDTYGIGKIHDIFSGNGVKHSVSSESNEHGMHLLRQHAKEVDDGLVFINLVDFDMKYGHRNNVFGYADALKEFDQFLGDFLMDFRKDDVLIITADHGCDPTHPGTDHTREHVPVLAYRRGTKGGDIGVRTSFADVGATIAELFGVEPGEHGKSFAKELMG